MEFIEEGEFLISNWKPVEYFSGYKKILHGGIQATLLDEIASWAVLIKLKTAGVTANLNVKYKNPVYTTEPVILIKARIEKHIKRLAFIQVQLFNSKGELCTEGDIKYFIFPEKVAKKKLHMPDYNEFFEKKDKDVKRDRA